MRLLRPWMSVRELAKCPWARMLLLALALMQCIAPTWHVCSLGGHASCHQNVASGHGAGGQTAHGFALAPVSAEAQEGRQPVICICLPEAEGDKSQPDLTAAPAVQGEPQCLALMLQSMPGHGAAQPELITFAARQLPLVANRPSPVALAEVRSHSGRGPPALT